jgi:hypothetical protein
MGVWLYAITIPLFLLMAFVMEFYMSKKEQLLKHLQAGKAFTAKQITASFGIANPSRHVQVLREQGYCVYSNPTTLSNGTVATKYRIGTPSRRIVALAQANVGAQAFTRA